MDLQKEQRIQLHNYEAFKSALMRFT